MHRLVLEEGTVQQLATIAAFVEEVCAAHAITDARLRYHLQLAVDEACANIFEHGYGGRAGRMEIEATQAEQRLTIRIQDWGRPFDPEGVPAPNPDTPLAERPIGGLGIHLMRQVMDEVHYHFDPQGGNVLTLQKSLA